MRISAVKKSDNSALYNTLVTALCCFGFSSCLIFVWNITEEVILGINLKLHTWIDLIEETQCTRMITLPFIYF